MNPTRLALVTAVALLCSHGIVAVPTAIALPGKARQVAVGLLSAYALLEDGAIGDGRLTTLRTLSAIGPVQVPALEGITLAPADPAGPARRRIVPQAGALRTGAAAQAPR